MNMRSRLLPRLSTSNPLDNRAHSIANINQAPDLEGLHHEMHIIAEQKRIMNENNVRPIQHLATANPLPPTPVPVSKSNDLVILNDQATTNLRVIGAQANHEIGDINRLTHAPGKKEVLCHQNPGRLAELPK